MSSRLSISNLQKSCCQSKHGWDLTFVTLCRHGRSEPFLIPRHIRRVNCKGALCSYLRAQTIGIWISPFITRVSSEILDLPINSAKTNYLTHGRDVALNLSFVPIGLALPSICPNCWPVRQHLEHSMPGRSPRSTRVIGYKTSSWPLSSSQRKANAEAILSTFISITIALYY